MQLQLVKGAIVQLTERGFTVHGAVCDGNYTIQKTSVLLGCNLSADLHNAHLKDNLHLANKITSRHIDVINLNSFSPNTVSVFVFFLFFFFFFFQFSCPCYEQKNILLNLIDVSTIQLLHKLSKIM